MWTDGIDVYSGDCRAGDREATDEEFASYVRESMWLAIKTMRDNLRFNGGVLVAGNWFLSSTIATSEYASLILIAQASGLPDNTVLRANWRTMNGPTVSMTPALAKQILAAGLVQVAAIDDCAQLHKAALDASPTPETYDINAGWPATYAP